MEKLKNNSKEYYDQLAQTHDSSLPQWGPYSQLYAGTTHIADQDRGTGFVLSAFPCFYRGRQTAPNELAHSNFYPWKASGDLSAYTYRFEMEWKDRIYYDISYIRAEKGVLIRIEGHNHTEVEQQMGIQFLMSMQYPKIGDRCLPWPRPANADEYQTWSHVESELPFTVTDAVLGEVELAKPDVRDSLTWDAQLFCEEGCNKAINGRVLGSRFGKESGNTACYHLVLPAGENNSQQTDSQPKDPLTLSIRLKGKGKLSLSGLVEETVSVDAADLTVLSFPVSDAAMTALSGIDNDSTTEKTAVLRLETLECESLALDCLILHHGRIAFVEDAPHYVPILSQEERALNLKYDENHQYRLTWDQGEGLLRTIEDSSWEKKMDHYFMDHVSTTLKGDGLAHHTNLYLRPLFLMPGEVQTIYAFISEDPSASMPENYQEMADQALSQLTNWEDPYAFGCQLLKATIMTNIAYPVYVQGQYIRHFTPGKHWMSLYTWDSGFIGLGLAAADLQRALETLNCYVTEPGNRHAAFVHHGSPVPVQAYIYKEIWDRTQDKAFLKSFYPRMKQYYEFLKGRKSGSTTDAQKTGLLSTFDYFYNSGGWDDYPPQVAVMQQRKTKTVTPVVTSTHVLVFAQILKHASKILGLGEETLYEEDIQTLSHALNTYAYDPESGYYSYVEHDENGDAVGIFRHESGANYNMGLDGAEIIMTGIASEDKEKRLADYIMDPAHMWTEYGISTVDQSAPYYRIDGYWNGSIWMPHQWFAFLGMLAIDRAEDACKIGLTALKTWEREAEASYGCYEHFNTRFGRGGGWPRFSGLSSPVLNWHKALFEEGTVTTSPDVFVLEKQVREDGGMHLVLDAGKSTHTTSAILVTVPEGSYQVTVNGNPLSEDELVRIEKALCISIPCGQSSTVDIVKTGN